ncbi:hypothetical protein [Mycobacterium sp.]|jgi:hypothetical protein|uniref:hypothetical protein n=1 Tax=Mycobacterium sp. TaxID=1785 RepID=UPI002626271B|nr:hypothetical protein [Mycobacterium sp.]
MIARVARLSGYRRRYAGAINTVSIVDGGSLLKASSVGANLARSAGLALTTEPGQGSALSTTTPFLKLPPS